MCTDPVVSVQSINCTDEFTKAIDSVLAQKKNLPPQTGGFLRSAHPPRLSHRALPPLRKALVQVHRGPRSWPQVLPVCQLSQSKTPARLCPPAVPEPSRAITHQLPETENPPRKHLRHQSGTPSKERGALTDGWLTHQCYPHRCRSCRNHTRQYAPMSLGYGQELRDRSTGGCL